jgi:hypothetical protein
LIVDDHQCAVHGVKYRLGTLYRFISDLLLLLLAQLN